MPDFLLCNARLCKYSDTCRRHPDSGTKPNTHRQSWRVIDHERLYKDGCDLYWHVSQAAISDDAGDDPWDIEPGESGDGRIVRKAIDDE